MSILKMNSSIFAIFVAATLLSSSSNNSVVAFSPNVAATTRLYSPTRNVVGTSGNKNMLNMAEGGDDNFDGVQVTSARKELKFDDKTGRFFETGLDTDECIPDEEFCTVDDETGSRIRLTIAEKERIFLDSLQSYYASGRQLLSDEDFDLLKEDLQWNGSPVVVVNRQETKYLAAMGAYLKGTPIMDDVEFDNLKKELKDTGSKFAVETEPKCYIDTGVCKVTLQKDKFRSNLLYLPAGALLSLVWLGLGFEIIGAIVPINPIILIALGSPLIAEGAKKITNEYIFKNNLVAYGPCPSCEYENRLYFGDILGVEGFGEEGTIKCPSCKTVFTVQRNSLRASTLPK